MSVLTVRFHNPTAAQEDNILTEQCSASSWSDVFDALDKANAEIARLKDLRQDQAQNYFKKWLASEEALEQLQAENNFLKLDSQRYSSNIKLCADIAETTSNLIKLISEQRDEALAENETLKKALHLYADGDDCWVDGAPDADNAGHGETCGYCIAMGVLAKSPQERALDEMVAESERLGLYDQEFACTCKTPIPVIYPGNDEVQRTVYCKQCLFDLPDPNVAK